MRNTVSWGTGSQNPSLISALKPAGMAAWLLSVTVTVTDRRPALRKLINKASTTTTSTTIASTVAKLTSTVQAALRSHLMARHLYVSFLSPRCGVSTCTRTLWVIFHLLAVFFYHLLSSAGSGARQRQLEAKLCFELNNKAKEKKSLNNGHTCVY